MEQDYKKQLEEIIDGLKCPKDFICYQSGFASLCKAQDIGMETFLDCLDEKSHECKFSVPTGKYYICKCPLRVYIAKNLGK